VNPEEIQELLAEVAAARADGMSDRQINAAFRRYRLPFDSVEALERVAGNMGVSASGGDSDPHPLRALAPLVQGFTGSLGSDLLDLLGKAGVGEGGDEFRSQLAGAREEAPFSSMGLQVAGGILGAPRVAVTKGIVPATRAVAGAAGRGAGRLAGRAGAGAAGQLGARGAAQTGAAIGTGGLLSAAEGAAVGFGERAGEEDRTPGLLEVGASGLLGAAGAGLGSSVGSFRRGAQAIKGRGAQVAQVAEDVAAGSPTRNAIQVAVDEADELRRAAFQTFEGAGRRAPQEVVDFLGRNPAARRVLQRTDSEEARAVVAAFRRGETPNVSVRLADQVRKELDTVGDAFATRSPTARGRLPRATEIDEAANAAEEMLGMLERVPGLREGMAATRLARGMERSAALGQRVAQRGVGADVAEALIRGERVTVLAPGGRPVSLPQTPEAIEAFRAGMLRPELLRLRGGTKAIDTFLDRLHGPELANKMRIALGGEENFRAFMQAAEHARALGDAGLIMQAAIKFGGFTILGSSVLAGGVAGVMLN
jgi:hypothetical protein